MHPLYIYLPLEVCSDLALLFAEGCGDCKSLRQSVLVTMPESLASLSCAFVMYKQAASNLQQQ